MCSNDFFLGLLAILFPPLPVWVKRGICSADSLINIMLCILGFVPGLLHAWYIIVKYPDQYDCYAPVAQEAHYTHGGHHHHHPPPQPHNRHHQQYHPHSQLHYSTFQQQPQQTPAAPVASLQNVLNSPGVGSRLPERYTRHEQQTPPETPVLESGEGSNQMQQGAPPSYASVVKGDHKVQTQD